MTTSVLSTSAEIDPTAHVDATSELGAGVRVGANAVVGPGCVIGAGTVLMHHAVIVEATTMGEGNIVHPFAVLGGDPQDKSFREDDRGELIIGDRNTFREFVTASRGNWNGPPTRIGSGCYLMTQAHIGHNAQAGDNIVMVQGAGLSGHSTLGDNCLMSGFTAVHQYVDVGQGVMFQAHAAVSMHVPPFVVLAGANTVAGLNRVGLSRNDRMTDTDRAELKELYRAIYRDRGTRPLGSVCADLDARQWGWAATEFLDFIKCKLNNTPPRRSGIVGSRARAGRGMRGRSA